MSRFTVIRDTREKKGHGWWYEEDAYCIGTEVGKVNIGDYTIKDREHVLCIERKESVAEFANNCSEKRFLKQLRAMSSFPHAFLLFEFGWDQIDRYPEGSGIPEERWPDIRIKAKYMMRVIASAMIEHDIHVIACGDKMKAEEIAFRIMRHVHEL